MTVRPYAGEGSKREQVERMFDAISPRYDLLNRLCSFGVDQRWRKRLVRALRAHAPQNVLDVATGTADLALLAARSGMRVTGVDISAGMLAGGRRKIERAHMSDRVRLIQADSGALPFDDAAFDAAMVAFGVRNFEDLEQGLKEIRRTVRPGGRLFVLEFSKPKGVLGALFRFYFHRVMPAIGRLVSKDARAYSYLPESVAAFPDGETFLTVLRICGFTDPTAQRLTGGIATLYSAGR